MPTPYNQCVYSVSLMIGMQLVTDMQNIVHVFRLSRSFSYLEYLSTQVVYVIVFFGDLFLCSVTIVAISNIAQMPVLVQSSYNDVIEVPKAAVDVVWLMKINCS